VGNKLPFNSVFIQQYLCQKLSKLVDVHLSFSVERHCRFFETQCIYNFAT